MESSLCEKPERHAPRRLSDYLNLEGLKRKVHSLVEHGLPRLTDTVSSDCESPFMKAGCGKAARPGVCPAKAGMFSRRKACRGKSQKPRSLDSRVAGNQDPEAYRQRLPRGDDESPGRIDSERESGLESE